MFYSELFKPLGLFGCVQIYEPGQWLSDSLTNAIRSAEESGRSKNARKQRYRV